MKTFSSLCLIVIVACLFSVFGQRAAAQVSNSLLGVNWIQAADGASFAGRMDHTSVVFNGMMWVIGGYDCDENVLNDVWSSPDGINWTEATNAAAFSPRDDHTSVMFNGRIWVIGGSDSGGNALNDVWSSPDGINWTEATNAAAFPKRLCHTSVVFNNKMWVIGGKNSGGNSLNDVWSSPDGINWTEATNAAAFPARRDHSSVVFNNKMWVVGGYNGNNYLNDVWASADGVSWTENTAGASFPGRVFHTSVVEGSLMWVIGGNNGSTTTNLNDVWSSPDGINWTEATNAAAFPARDRHTSVVYNNLIWVIGGLDSGSVPLNDVWYSSSTPVSNPTPPQPVLITFQNQLHNITTDLAWYPVFVYDYQASNVTVNGQSMYIPNSGGQYVVIVYGQPPQPVYYGGQLNFPLNQGTNSFLVKAWNTAGTLLWSVTNTVIRDTNYSLAGRELLYASVPDLTNSAITDTVVIDPAANVVLGYLPGEEVTAADPQGQFVVAFDGTANHVYSTVTGRKGIVLPFTAGAASAQYPLMTADGYGYWGNQKIRWSNGSLLPVTLPLSVDSRRCSLLSGGLLGVCDFSHVYVMNESSVINTYTAGVALANHSYAAITPDGAYALETSFASAQGAIQSFRLKDGADCENPASDYLEEIVLSADGTQAIIGAYGNSWYGGGGIYVVGITTGGMLLPYGNTGPVVTQFGASSVALGHDGTVYTSARFLQAVGGTVPQWGMPDNRGVAAFTFGSDGYLYLTAKYFLADWQGYDSGHRIIVKPAPATVSIALIDSTRTIIISLNGYPGSAYNIEASTDLMHWSTIATVTADSSGKGTYFESMSGPMRFYRTTASD
jgi:hypothetical protein